MGKLVSGSVWEMFFGPYLPSDAQERLRKYVYCGTDKSLFYKYIFRPLCVGLVEHLPLWLSANVISITGFLLVFTTHMLLAFYMPKLTAKGETNRSNFLNWDDGDAAFNKEYLPSPPAIIFVFNAISLLLYAVLDNLDGHQARRTQTASPLGLIIDHGCDALNCIVVALSVASTLSLGPTWKSWVFLVSIVTGFFMNTWEEYYIGELVLPIVNGANEGILLVVFVYLFTAWVKSPQWWYNNGLMVSHSLLPKIMRQPAQLAAVSVERNVLQTVCPWITIYPFSLFKKNNFFISGLFGFNCSDAYIASPPLPVIASNTEDHGTLFTGHSKIQDFVLGLYDSYRPDVIWIRFNTLAVMIFVFFTVVTILGNLISVYRVVSQNTGEQTRWPKVIYGLLRFARVLLRLLPLVTLLLLATFWLFTSPTDIFRRRPRIFCWVFGIIFTKFSVTVMLAHICAIDFSLYCCILWPFFFYGCCMLITYFFKIANFSEQGCLLHYNLLPSFVVKSDAWAFFSNEENILCMYFLLSVFYLMHLVFGVLRETASALKISIFFVPYDIQEAARKQIIKIDAAKRKGVKVE